MGKRRVRIFNKDIETRYNEVLNREANLILYGKKTLHGNVLSLENNAFTVKDTILRTHKVALQDIEEINFDIDAKF
ncbi:MAG TPA: hypothetical protein VF691_10285 [Cytophagaceae bacterium]|jgi:hypothetical protein